jgi:DNA-binding response OmpR family regulator
MPYKIILADDSPSVQKLIHMSFSASDFDILTFNDGQEVIETIHQVNPDAVLLNLSLPQKDGYEVGAYIREHKEFAQVILILIKEAFEPLDKEKLAGFEFDELVQKPFDSEKLAETVLGKIEEKKVPVTFPEDPIRTEGFPPEEKVALDEQIKDLVKQEILQVERELEKRIKARVIAEIKMWLINSSKNK